METRMTSVSSFETEAPVVNWLTFPMRISRLMFAALVAGSGLLGYSLGNGHTTSSAIQNVSQQLGQKQAELHKLKTVVIPKLAAANHCEGARADKASTVAKQAITGALVADAPVPSPSAIPADNCPH